ncbi:methyltransferase domain-containing protein [Pseudosulfitobacter sp. SM2401]|uniref:class I SAM-dependent DNA methyltransferase n=1 Tax=Pseudosulfitobacter sp. SM2401 TaxID=3350098 RepID=UPI0036F3D938
MNDDFLSKSYGKSTSASVRAHYDAWATSYNDEITKNGYATPGRCASALAQFADDLAAPVLDFGCGTGLSGLALRLAGFDLIDGLDLSPDMLAQAETSGAYRTLDVIKAGANLPSPSGTYANMAAIGVIGAGAAPISVFHMLMKALPRSGKLVFSFNDHAIADASNEGAISEWTDCGAAQLLFKEYGEHLPGINLKSNVYVIEKA